MSQPQEEANILLMIHKGLQKLVQVCAYYSEQEL